MSFHVYGKNGSELELYHSCETLKIRQDCVNWTLENAQHIEDDCDSEVWFIDAEGFSIFKIELKKEYSVHVIDK